MRIFERMVRLFVMGHHQTRKTPPNKKNTLKQGETPSNKGKHPQTRGNTSKQVGNTTKQEKPQQARKHLSSKGYLPIKCKSLQVVGVSGQGKAVVSDGG